MHSNCCHVQLNVQIMKLSKGLWLLIYLHVLYVLINLCLCIGYPSCGLKERAGRFSPMG